MRKIKFILLIIVISNKAHSQSKNEQIIQLNLELDSLKNHNKTILNQVLEINSTCLKTQEKLNSEIDKNEITIDHLNASILKMKTENDSLKMLLVAKTKNVFPYKISRELTTQFDEGEWKALCQIPIYKTDEFKETIGSIRLGEKFTMLDDYYLIEQPILGKITNIVQIDEECGIYDFRVGDEIKLLIGYGECQWSLLHNDSLKFATFGFDGENKKLIDCEYDGCTKIRGDIISTNERKSFIVKIKYNGEIGWIKYILDDINKYEFSDFIQSDY